MVRLIVADFDGTIMPHGQNDVSAEVINNIKRFIDKGIYFAVASGRTYSDLKKYLSEVSDYIYFIADDGALTLKNDIPIFKKPITKNALDYFFNDEIFQGADLFSIDSVYKVNNICYQNYGKRVINIRRSFEIIDDVYKVVALSSCDKKPELNNLRKHFEEGSNVEYVSLFANKGLALFNLQLHLSISKFDTIAIGDSYNDVPLTKYADKTICISNKCPELASLSQNVVSDINEAFDIIKKYCNC